MTALEQDALAALSQEYDKLQHYLQTREDLGLYSANKQQADRFYKKIKKRQYPISVRNDLIKIGKNPNTVSEYWARIIPVKTVRGGVWIGIKPYEPLPINAKVCESTLYKRGNNWFLHLMIEQDIPERSEYQNVIGIDMGIKHIATSVELASGKTIFYGKQLNRIRGPYFWLRKTLGKAKAIDTIKKIGKHESRTTNDLLHKISREIVNQAIATDAAIVIGDLKYLRKNRMPHRQRKRARLLNNFPYFRLTQYIKYKAALAGTKVIVVSEAWTSQTCTRCYKNGNRLTQGLFKCEHCKIEENADRNAAFNIAKRGLGYMSKLGVFVNMPKTPAMHSLSAMMSGEAIALAR